MLLEIRAAAARRETNRDSSPTRQASRAGILALLGGDSLKPRRLQKEGSTEDDDFSIVGSSAPAKPVEDIRYSHFRRMLKLGVPRPKLELDMESLGLTPEGLDGPVPASKDFVHIEISTPELKAAPQETVVRRKWHFEEVSATDRALPPPCGSHWSRRSKAGQLPDAAKQRIERYFTKPIDSSKDVECSSTGSADMSSDDVLEGKSPPVTVKRGSVVLLKHDKALTMEIALNAVKVPFSVVAEELEILSGSSLTETAIKTILSMWPSMGEQRALDEFAGPLESLSRCEEFLVTIQSVPHAREKLRCLLVKKEFPRRIHELRETILLVTRALNQLNASAEFERLLSTVLDVANYLNWGEAGDQHRQWISIESLVKLAHTKSFDGSLTVLDLVVDVIQSDYRWDLLQLVNGFQLISQCQAISVDTIYAEMEQLRQGHRLLVAESVASAKTKCNSTAQDDSSRQAVCQFADIVNDELSAVEKLLNDLERSRLTFVSKFEQSKSASLDSHLAAIAQFVAQLKSSAKRSINWSALQ